MNSCLLKVTGSKLRLFEFYLRFSANATYIGIIEITIILQFLFISQPSYLNFEKKNH